MKTENREKHTTKKVRCRFLLVIPVLVLLFCGGLILNIYIGSVHIPMRDVFSMLWNAVCLGINNIFSGGRYTQVLQNTLYAGTESRIVFDIRMPRMLLAAVLGGALSVSGLLLQTFFRNPIAGPFVLGISSGAKTAVGITMVFLAPRIGYMFPSILVVAAFIGALFITALVLLFAQRVKNMAVLLVIGIMVGYICSAVSDLIVTFANDHDILNLTGWSMGSFSGASWKNVQTAIIICVPTLLCAWLFSKPMEAYALGEGYAASLGVNILRLRAALILLSCLLSACVTALAGPISFVGIAVPHIARTLLKSTRPVYLIPTCFICGAVFCLFCDLIARTVFAPTELAIGTVTSVFGAPVVIYVMIRRRRSQEA